MNLISNMKRPACYLILFFIYASASIVNCSGQKVEPFEIPIDGKFVYVEGLRGEGWLTANPFGELVMIDGDTQTRHVLTWDGYYYAHPNLTPDGQSLIFESKRSRNIGIAGLSADSDIYKLDLETKEIINLNDVLSETFGEPIGHRVGYPSLSYSGDKLAIIRLVDWQFHLSIIDNRNKKIVDISTDDQFNPSPAAVIEWSRNDNYFIYERFAGFNMMVVLVDVENLNTSVIKPIINGNNELDVHSCKAGSWIGDYKFIYQCKRRDVDFTDILEYDINNKSSRILKSIDNKKFEMTLVALKVNKNEDALLFIGIDHNTKEQDIWKLDLNSDSLEKITTNGYQKGWLRWYEDL